MPGDDCNHYNFAILMTSGVTCLLLVLDLASRYLGFQKKDEDKIEAREVQEARIQPMGVSPVGAGPGIRAAGFGLEPLTEEDREMLSGQEKPQVIISKVRSLL